MKRTVKLTERELKRIVNESVNKIISEAYGTPSKKDLRMACRYSDAPHTPYNDTSWTTKDDYNDISPEIHNIALGFKNIKDIIRSLRFGIKKDKYTLNPNLKKDIVLDNGFVVKDKMYRRVMRDDIKPKNSKDLEMIVKYLDTLDKIADKGSKVLSLMSDRIIQNFGFDPTPGSQPWFGN